MNLNKLVSIITPSYNSARFIEECILSVIAQTYENWELLIVDDCSKDNSLEIINSLANQDNRIRIICLDKNVGAAEARNIAIRQAKGKYISFLDSDDMWSPKKLAKQIFFMQENSLGFSYTAYQFMSEDSTSLTKIIQAPHKMTYHEYLKNTIIGCLTVIIDREKVGDFEMPNIRSSHDMALWLLIMKRGFAAFGLNENLASYRLVSNSNTSSKFIAVQDVWKVYREIEKLPYFYSVWCWLNYTFNAFLKRF